MVFGVYIFWCNGEHAYILPQQPEVLYLLFKYTQMPRDHAYLSVNGLLPMTVECKASISSQQPSTASTLFV